VRTQNMQIGVAVKVFDMSATVDLGIAHVPFPVEVGDGLAVEGYPWPLEIVDVIATPVGARVTALVKVRPAPSGDETSHSAARQPS
jgi:hypothetical protein